MFVDFPKYPFMITDIILNPNHDFTKEYTSLIINTSNNNIKFKIEAFGDCCSISIIKKYKNYDFQNLKNKIIESIEEIKVPNDDIFSDDDEDIDDTYLSYHLYQIKFKDDNEDFKFIMINYSNGYYDGWIDISLQ